MRYEKKRRGLGAIEVAEIPEWAMDSTRRDGPSLAAALALADLEGKWIRLSASVQRRALGFSVFGKKSIFSDGNAGVRVMHSAAFGTDASVYSYSWDDITRAAGVDEARRKMDAEATSTSWMVL